MTDPIADMLTRIRNALLKRHELVEIPSSKTKEEIAKILQREGLVHEVRMAEHKNQGKIVLRLKYFERGRSTIQGLKRISSPGRRVYVGYRELRPVYNGLGFSVLSTPKGILTDQTAREMKVGGELLLNIW